MHKDLFILFIAFLLWQCVFVEAGLAAEARLKRTEVHLNVLLISIEGYDLEPLRYASHDIEKLSTLFQTRFGAASKAVIDFSKTFSELSNKQGIESEITKWCNHLTEQDTAVLYIAGHGLVGPDKRLYLPMTDFDRKNFDTACIPMEWIRDKLSNAKAKAKLVLLDTCYAGVGRDLETVELTNAEEVAHTFDNLQNVVTLASSRGDQKSWLWTERKHSLYTFWLIEGFRGNADKNNDRLLELEELFKYLDENVYEISSSDSSMKPQNPVILGKESSRKEFKLPLVAMKAEDALENASILLDMALRRNLSDGKNDLVIIPEFMTGAEGDNVIQDEYGTLPRLFANQLRQKLLERRGQKVLYEVLSANETQDILEENGLRPQDMGTKKTKSLKSDGEAIRFIVVGRICTRAEYPATLDVEIKLVKAQRSTDLCSVRSSIFLTSAQLAQMGKSGALPNEPRSDAPNEFVDIPGSGLVKPSAVYSVSQMLEASEKQHPMLGGTIAHHAGANRRRAARAARNAAAA